MLESAFGKQKTKTLMGEYASLLGDAVLRQRAREAEHTAQIQAELASRVKSEFISTMSHELRTPLNTTIGFSKILCEHKNRNLPDDVVVEYATLIHDAASHLLTVINDILDISKIQSGKYTLDASTLNLREILALTLSKNQPDADDAGLTIINRIPKSLPELRGDQGKLLQVFDNLLANAIKFTERGGQVTISAIRQANDSAAVSIHDTGVGMSPEEIRIALEPFSQVDGTRARWREGAGLGLPIAKALVDLHGGRLDIESKKGSGTTVTVVLPSRHEVSIAHRGDAILGR